MEPSQNEQPTSQPRPFAPFIANTFQIKGDLGIDIGATSYNEKHNMIITCPRDSSLQFYNATTLEPLEGFETKELDSPALVMSFYPETETFLLGYSSGDIYTYDLCNKILEKVHKDTRWRIPAITFLNSKYYAFSSYESRQLSIGNLENGDILNFNLEFSHPNDLFSLTKRKLLFSSSACGSVQVYRTDQLPKLPVMSSIRGFSNVSQSNSRKAQCIIINGKEYIVTAGSDCPVRIWHLSKGKMKLLKVIHMGEQAYDMVYLEEYKMLATTHNAFSMRFLRLPSGKLESKVHFMMKHCLGIFLMKDKNALGVTNLSENQINIVKFSPKDGESLIWSRRKNLL